MAWTQAEFDSAYKKAKVKATSDADFRKKLLANPSKAIFELTGKEIPANFKIKVIESDPAYQATFVLPDLVSDEMSDEDLKKVAGGACAGQIVGKCNDACGAAA